MTEQLDAVDRATGIFELHADGLEKAAGGDGGTGHAGSGGRTGHVGSGG